MKIHHLSCVSSCPLGGAWMDGLSTDSVRGRLACHCLLVESNFGLVLVDTGLGLRDVAAPRTRLSRVFFELMKPDLRPEMTAIRQIQQLGFRARDVRHIVLTHLDFDHAGGLDDFPEARVHLLADEQTAAFAQKTLLDRMRYRPAQWSTRSEWETHRPAGEPWFGFDCVRDIPQLGNQVLLVPLTGHTLGHAGVAVRADDGWFLMAGDAYFYHREMDLDHPYCTPGLRVYQNLMEKDRGARLHNQERLRDLRRRHGHEVTILSAHDVVEFERVSRRSVDLPIAPNDPGYAGDRPGGDGRGRREPDLKSRSLFSPIDPRTAP